MSTRTILKRREGVIKVQKEETLMILRAYQMHPCKWVDVVSDVKQNLALLPADVRKLYETASTKKLRDRMSTKLSKLMKKPHDQVKDVDIRIELRKIRTLETRLLERPADSPAQITNSTDTVRDTAAQDLSSTDSDSNDELIIDPTPGSLSDPVPRYAPGPATGLAPRPIPGPAPRPAPGPAPGPVPRPVPGLTHVHAPGPAPRPAPGPAPMPAPRPAPRPAPGPVPRPVPGPDPGPAPVDAPGPEPGPAPGHRRPKKRSLMSIVRENQLLYNTFIKKKIPKLLKQLDVSSSDDD